PIADELLAEAARHLTHKGGSRPGKAIHPKRLTSEAPRFRRSDRDAGPTFVGGTAERCGQVLLEPIRDQTGPVVQWAVAFSGWQGKENAAAVRRFRVPHRRFVVIIMRPERGIRCRKMIQLR